MPKPRRLQLIRSLEKNRKTRVLSYVTSTRRGLDTAMDPDHVRLLYNHVQKMNGSNIDLFIHSNGGEVTVPWKLVNIIRGAAKKFSVLVPYRAFSAATLVALGADEIIMHPMGNLGPTDPTVSNAFNPRDPLTNMPIGINVEDVNAYLQLVKDDAGIQHQDELVKAFNVLAEKVHPLALGNVKRIIIQSRMMAKKILMLHMEGTGDEHRIDELVENFTSKLYYHAHPINRDEAINELGMKNVQKPPKRVETAMWNLYLEYEREMKMNVEFDPSSEFITEFSALAPGDSDITSLKNERRVYIESTERTDYHNIQYQIYGLKEQDGSIKWSMNVLEDGWTQED